MSEIPQFGERVLVERAYVDRPGAYGVVFDSSGKILVVCVRGERLHLPGGGIDAGEDAETAFVREVVEETGLVVAVDRFIGCANQYLPYASIGPLNKLGTFFVGHVVEALTHVEADHEPMWVTVEDFLSSSANDFHKWAVQKAKNHL